MFQKFKDWAEENKIFLSVTGAGVVTAGVLVASCYKVALPHEVLVKTGPWLPAGKKLLVCKNTFQIWPQVVTRMNVTPWKTELHVDGLTKDVQYVGLPLTGIVGPNPDKLEEYATFMGGVEDVDDVIHGLISAEARAVTAQLDVHSFFGDKAAFRQVVQTHIQEDLNPLGLKIWQLGFQDIEDSKSHKDGKGTQYFHYLRQVKASEAEQTAREKVATMEKMGDSSVKKNESETRINKAKYEAEAVAVESENNILVAKHLASLEIEREKARKAASLAKTEVDAAIELEKQRLMQEVNVAKAKQEMENERAGQMPKTIAECEAIERKSLTNLFQAEQLAKAKVLTAEAEAKSIILKASADAEGILKKYQAEAQGLRELKDSLGTPEVLLSYQMINKGTYEVVANATSKALQGMAPNVSVWNMNNGNGATNDTFTSLAPFLKVIGDAVGVDIPNKKQ